MDNPFLIGSKVYLRPLEAGDARTLVRWMNDVDVTRTLGIYRPMTEENERDFIERVSKSPDQIGLAIMARRDDRFVGTAGLMTIDWRNRLAEFGISIGDKASWGHGYATEATWLLTGYAFRRLNLNRVWLRVHEYNGGAIRAYERVGFRREGTFRRAAYVDGHYRDVHVMALLRDEWRPELGDRASSAGTRTTAAPKPGRGTPARSRIGGATPGAARRRPTRVR